MVRVHADVNALWQYDLICLVLAYCRILNGTKAWITNGTCRGPSSTATLTAWKLIFHDATGQS